MSIPFTRDMAKDFAGFLEWALDASLTSGQKETIVQHNKDKMVTQDLLELIVVYRGKQYLSPEEQEKLRSHYSSILKQAFASWSNTNNKSVPEVKAEEANYVDTKV